MLRSGKGYDGPTMPKLVADKVVTENHQALIQEKKVSTEEDSKKEEGEVQAKPLALKVPVEPYKPKILFPQALKQNKNNP